MEFLYEILGDLRLIQATQIIIVFASSKNIQTAFLLDRDLLNPYGVDLNNFRVQKGQKIIYCYCVSYVCKEDIKVALKAVKEISDLPACFYFVYSNEDSAKLFTNKEAVSYLRSNIKDNDNIHFIRVRTDNKKIEF
jgi:hypothetical protein